MTGNRAVFLTTLAGLLIVAGIEIGEARARQQIATVCEQQPGATLASSVQRTDGLLCIYIDQPQTGRVQRKQKATKA